MKITKAQSQENRARVVETASVLFRERGFDGVSVADLVIDPRTGDVDRARTTHRNLPVFNERSDAKLRESIIAAEPEPFASALRSVGAQLLPPTVPRFMCGSVPSNSQGSSLLMLWASNSTAWPWRPRAWGSSSGWLRGAGPPAPPACRRAGRPRAPASAGRTGIDAQCPPARPPMTTVPAASRAVALDASSPPQTATGSAATSLGDGRPAPCAAARSR